MIHLDDLALDDTLPAPDSLTEPRDGDHDYGADVIADALVDRLYCDLGEPVA